MNTEAIQFSNDVDRDQALENFRKYFEKTKNENMVTFGSTAV